MKKFLVVLLALAMVLSMSSLAFAYGDPEPTAEEVPATDSEGNEVAVEQDDLPYYDAAAQEVRAAGGEAEELVESVDLTEEVEEALEGTGYAVEDLTITSPIDVTVKGDASKITWPLTIVLNVKGAKVGKPAVVLHKGKAGWGVVPSEVKNDDEVEATFDDLSPVVVLLATGEGSAPVAKYEDYSDLEKGAWYEEFVTYAVEKGLMGVGMTEFHPEWGVTRGDFITTIYRVAGEPTGAAAATYTDIAEASDYMVPAIDWATAEGIVEGSDGKINATDLITREQVVAILYRYFGKLGLTADDTDATLADFADAADVSSWANTAMAWAVKVGLIVGDEGSLYPGRTITRAELATVLTRWETEIAK